MKPLYANIPMMLLGLAVTVGGILLYVYMYMAVNASFARAILARSVVDSQKQDSVDEAATLALFNNTVASRARLASFFVSDSQAVTFIESLEQIGQEVGSTVTISSVSADDTSALKPGSFANMHAHVNVSGSWASVMRVLKLSEILPYQTSIGNVNLIESTVGTGKAEKRVWQASYDVTATLLVGSAPVPQIK